MSVINQMLQDLEKRRAGAAEGAAMPNQVRPLPVVPATAGQLTLVSIGVAVLIIVAAAIWWTWRSSSTAPQVSVPPPLAVESPPAPAPAPARPAPGPIAAPIPSIAAPVVAAPTPSIAAPVVAKPAQDDLARIERKGLRLSPTLHVPPKIVDRSAVQASAPAASVEPATHIEPAPKLRAEIAQGSIKKQARPVSPRERADVEYRRATAALSQGRADEAEEALHAALTEDATYDAARQALAGMLVEQKRFDEAKKLLQEYLSSHPNHLGFAMLLARLQLDRGDSAGAMTTMQRSQPYAGENADFLGFSAAVLQRAGQHSEAVNQYRAALRLKPDAAVWWMGLGISLQESDHRADALDAFRQALSKGSLSPDLHSFVELRIKQLSP